MSKSYGPATERSYQCFMGRWEGNCKTFTPKGIFLEATLVHMDVYWVDENTWHLHEHFENEIVGYIWHEKLDLTQMNAKLYIMPRTFISLSGSA